MSIYSSITLSPFYPDGIHLFLFFFASFGHLYGKIAQQLKHSAARLIFHEFTESSCTSCCHLSAHKAASSLPYATYFGQTKGKANFGL